MASHAEDSVPTILFKYCAPTAVENLSEYRLTAGDPVALNDPFEFAITPVWAQTPEDWYHQMEAPGELEAYLRHLESRYSGRPGLYQSILAEFGRDWKAALARHANSIMMSSARAAEIMRDSASKIACIVSLSATATHPLLWAHYANGHTGFVVGLRPDGIGMVQHPAERVTYRPKKPRVRLRFDRRLEVSSNLKFPGTVKGDDWKYEQEWRFFVKPANTFNRHCQDRKSRSFVSYDPAAVACVVVGMKSTSETEESIRDILLRPELSHVRLKYATEDPLLYQVRLSDARDR